MKVWRCHLAGDRGRPITVMENKITQSSPGIGGPFPPKIQILILLKWGGESRNGRPQFSPTSQGSRCSCSCLTRTLWPTKFNTSELRSRRVQTAEAQCERPERGLLKAHLEFLTWPAPALQPAPNEEVLERPSSAHHSSPGP